ncbi:MAG: coproporphyrinogen III oxidase family protein [Bryobacteraceae bacterium]|nr:coproporphyrinogen III oxidase family protein [Bryobacteraceae bacterium]
MAGVYISYPFCAQKCTYCNFGSGLASTVLEAAYEAALRGEIRNHQWSWRPETLYLGGGSPSRWQGEGLAAALSELPGAPWREATIEAAPGEITREKARGWRTAGINRASLGVQSFNQREIARTGRKHTAAMAAEQVMLLREEGIRRINIDLIAGLPGQTAPGWNESLDWIEKLAPGHASIYMLEVDEDSRLGRELLSGGARYGALDVPPETAIVDFYETAVERLERIGLRRYEISNFARPGEESLHNLKYWRLEPYAGFGADAHSFDGRTRRQNAASAAEYVERHRSGLPFAIEETPACPGEERFFVGLRLAEGIPLDPRDARRFEGPISRFIAAGLLERQSNRLKLTPRGVLLSNEVFQEFLTQ